MNNLDIISNAYINQRPFYDSTHIIKRRAAAAEPLLNPVQLKPLAFRGMIIAHLMRVKPVCGRPENTGVIIKIKINNG